MLKGQLPRGAALFEIISQLSQPGNGLHPLRDVDAEQVHAAADDTRHLPGQPETHRAGRCILFPEDRMVMVVSVELLGQLVDIGADNRGAKFSPAAATTDGYSVSVFTRSISSGR